MRKFRINRYGILDHIFDVEMKVWYGWTLIKRFKADVKFHFDDAFVIKYAQERAEELLEKLEEEILIDVIPKFNDNAQHSADNLYVCDNMVYRKCELDFLNVDWEQRRYELAKDFTAGIISAHTVEEMNNSFLKNENEYKAVIDLSVSLADSLIKKLKGE